MSLVQRQPQTLDALHLAAFDRLRRVGAARADRRRVLECEGARYLMSVDVSLMLRAHLVTLQRVAADDSLGFAQSMVALEERAVPDMAGAPNAQGLLLRALADGVVFEHPARLRGEPVWRVLPRVWPPESLQLTGLLSQHLDQADGEVPPRA